MEGGLAPDTMSGPDVHLWTPSDVINWCRSTLDQRYPGVSFAQMLDTWEQLHLIDGPLLLQMDALEWKEAVPSIGARRLLRREVGALGGGRAGSRRGSEVEFDAGRRGSRRVSELGLSPPGFRRGSANADPAAALKAGWAPRIACCAPPLVPPSQSRHSPHEGRAQGKLHFPVWTGREEEGPWSPQTMGGTWAVGRGTWAVDRDHSSVTKKSGTEGTGGKFGVKTRELPKPCNRARPLYYPWTQNISSLRIWQFSKGSVQGVICRCLTQKIQQGAPRNGQKSALNPKHWTPLSRFPKIPLSLFLKFGLMSPLGHPGGLQGGPGYGAPSSGGGGGGAAARGPYHPRAVEKPGCPFGIQPR